MGKSFIAGSALALVLASPVAAGVTIDLFPNYGPPSVASHGVYEPGFDPTPSLFVYGANAVGAMLDNQLSRGGSQELTPGAFNTLPDFRIHYDYFRRTEFPSWGPTIYPGGAFAGEKGTVWRIGVRIESTTPFTAAGLLHHFDSILGTETSTLADRLVHEYPEGGFDPTLAVGINYGPDGIRGTTDDIVCDSLACDPYTQPLNLLAWRGVGIGELWLTEDLNSLFGGDWEALRADDRAFWWGQPPYEGLFPVPATVRESWTVTGLNGEELGWRSATGIVVGVPEPSSWALMIAGFGIIGGTLRRRDSRAAA